MAFISKTVILRCVIKGLHSVYLSLCFQVTVKVTSTTLPFLDLWNKSTSLRS